MGGVTPSTWSVDSAARKHGQSRPLPADPAEVTPWQPTNIHAHTTQRSRVRLCLHAQPNWWFTGGDAWGYSAMTDEAPVLAGREIVRHRLTDLLLDADNPRFGLQEAGNGQAELLDHIVQKFGVDDVLRSLA